MLRRLLAWFLGKPRRQIYRYWNGAKWAWGDPLELWLRLREAPFDWDTATQQANDGDKAAIEQLVGHVSHTFATRRYDPRTDRGLTILEHFNLLDEFMRYLDELKKSLDPGPMDSQPSGLGGSGMPQEISPGPTSSTSASRSTGSESSAAEPGG